jgi:hypothetical protein
MSSTKVDLSKVLPGRTNIDRKCEQEARPNSGSDNRASQGSQSNGAGSSWKNAGASVNGMGVILRQSLPSDSVREITAVPKSKTPNKQVQAAKANRTRVENGKADPKGGSRAY